MNETLSPATESENAIIEEEMTCVAVSLSSVVVALIR